MSSSKNRVVAFFDFDGTLAEGDSLWPFLLAVRGPFYCLFALGFSVLHFLFNPSGQDRRTVIKAKLLERILKGRSLEEIEPAIQRMKRWPRWLEATKGALLKHHEDGHLIVIATGSLDIYMKAILKDALPYDELLSTEMEIVDGVLTGRMRSGNCVRTRKAQRVADYITVHGPFADSWAYGNLPHDLPMMELVKHRSVV